MLSVDLRSVDMSSDLDWFLYALEPRLLSQNLINISDEDLVKLIRIFLFHADRHEIRNANSITNRDHAPSGVVISYNKAKTFDNLALIIVTHFRFSVNIFSGIVSEIPLTLALRIYRSLINTLLKREDHNAGDVLWSNPIFIDICSWDGLTATLAYSALVFHLWCLQIVISNSTIPQPCRNQTPSVYGLSELPDGSYLSSNAGLRKNLYECHLISVQRLQGLLLCLTGQNQIPLFMRPTIADFSNQIDEDDQRRPLLSSNMVISGVAIVLGRLAFEKNLMSKAFELFSLAKEKMIAEKLEYIEEVGCTSQMIDYYLICCQQEQRTTLFGSSVSTAHWFLMDSFYNSLLHNLCSEDFKFDLTLVSSRSNCCSSLLRQVERTEFSLDEVITSLEAELCTPAFRLGFGLRSSLRRSLIKIMSILSTDKFVNNGIYFIRQSALARVVAFCDTLLTAIENGSSHFDAEKVIGLLFSELSRCVGGADNFEVSKFIREFLDQIILNLSVGQSASRAAHLIKLLADSSVTCLLPNDVQNVFRNKIDVKKCSDGSIEKLFADLPDVATKDNSFSSPLSQRIASHRELRSNIRDVSYLMSPDPKVVLSACGDLLMSGMSLETIIRSGGWLDTVLPIVLKWSTKEPPIKQRRDTALAGSYSSPYEFLTVMSENLPYLPPLILLFQAVEYRRERMDFETSRDFLSVSEYNLPGAEGKQDSPFAGSGAPFWRRSLPRWIREMVEHEKVILNIVRAITDSSHQISSEEHSQEMDLLHQCKRILIDDLGPDRIVSEDLLACAACYILIKEPSFLSEYKGRQFIASLVSQLYNLSSEKTNFTKAAYSFCTNFLLPSLRSARDKPKPYLQKPPNTMAPSYPAFRSRGPSGPHHLSSLSGFSTSTSDLSTLVFPLKLLVFKNFVEGHTILDCLFNCLATYLKNDFKIDTTAEQYNQTLSPGMKSSSQELSNLLQLVLTIGIESETKNVNWLITQAHLQAAAPYSNPRMVLNLILQAAAIESNYFSRRVPSSIFSNQTLEIMIFGCQSMGCIGEAVVLCQFGGKAHIKMGIQIIKSAAKAPSTFCSYDSMESMTIFLWDLQLLESLCNLQQFNQAFPKRTCFLRCINQLEVNASNNKKTLKLAIRKRETEFLRYLSLKIVSG
ncbi:hypothetical protein Aperf_G00000047577 [Anoplocephala perfoliata]